MKEITKKLRLNFADKFLTIAQDLRNEGQDDYEIKKIFFDFVKQETFRFYRMKQGPQLLGDSIKDLLNKQGDSKIESIYYDILKRESIPFEFQYKIGPFRADFLIYKFIFFEIDGPMHDKEKDKRRDAYMKKMGYKVFRVPSWLAAVSHSAVVDEIKELISENNK